MLKTLLGCQQKLLLEYDLTLVDACLLTLAHRSPGLPEASFRQMVTEKIPLLGLKDDSLRRKIRALQQAGIFKPVHISLTDKGLTVMAMSPAEKNPLPEKNPSSSSSLYKDHVNEIEEEKKERTEKNPLAEKNPSSSSLYNNNVNRIEEEKKEEEDAPAEKHSAGSLMHRACCQIYESFFFRPWNQKAPFGGMDVGVWYQTCETWRDKHYNPSNTSGLLNMYSQQTAFSGSYANLWEVISGILLVLVNRPSFNTWIRPLELVEIHVDGHLATAVPPSVEIILSANATTVYWIGEHYLPLLTSLAAIFDARILLQESFAF